MTRSDIRKALIEDPDRAKEVRTSDGRSYLIRGVEYWALGGDQLLVVHGKRGEWAFLSLRHVAAIGPAARRRGA